MAFQNSSLILFFMVSLYLVASVTSARTQFDQLSPSIQVPSDDLALATRICNKTDYPPLCLDTVVPSLKGQRVDLKFVLGVLIQAGDEYAKVALSAVNRLFDSGATSPGVKDALKLCKDLYNMAVNGYDMGLDAFATYNVPDMNIYLGSEYTLVGGCEDEFVRIGIASPMLEYAKKLKKLTSNCLSIIQDGSREDVP